MTCNKCGGCCRRHPCCLHPKDLNSISKFLKISIDELITKYLTIDYYILDNEYLYYFSPRRYDDDSIKIVEFCWAFSESPCIFLNNSTNLCEIHEVKPFEGKNYDCTNYEELDREKLIKTWQRNKILKKYVKLLGGS